MDEESNLDGQSNLPDFSQILFGDSLPDFNEIVFEDSPFGDGLEKKIVLAWESKDYQQVHDLTSESLSVLPSNPAYHYFRGVANFYLYNFLWGHFFFFFSAQNNINNNY